MSEFKVGQVWKSKQTDNTLTVESLHEMDGVVYWENGGWGFIKDLLNSHYHVTPSWHPKVGDVVDLVNKTFGTEGWPKVVAKVTDQYVTYVGGWNDYLSYFDPSKAEGPVRIILPKESAVSTSVSDKRLSNFSVEVIDGEVQVALDLYEEDTEDHDGGSFTIAGAKRLLVSLSNAIKKAEQVKEILLRD